MRLWPRTLTGRLTLALNGALVIGVAAFSLWDINALIADRFEVKRNALFGVAEALSPDGRPFGRDQVVRSVLAWRDRPITEVIALLRQAILTHLAGEAPNDDMTALGIER